MIPAVDHLTGDPVVKNGHRVLGILCTICHDAFGTEDKWGKASVSARPKECPAWARGGKVTRKKNKADDHQKSPPHMTLVEAKRAKEKAVGPFHIIVPVSIIFLLKPCLY